ncbi:Thioesterase/thiol ester dehydrase-isomerase [Trichodelitschia bisporula]|uniref:Thioesterase/thiol ester dehydrase-isomerase n=1 Tax=Trichodelitschia bisporula TaxID=703511 RepID=A0A6G1HUC6_9PEZI|nr:Thioesterase/thiol ester dehydrase-isomerase [Trichodelitschia bisporula]
MSSDDSDASTLTPFERIKAFWEFVHKERSEFFDAAVKDHLQLVSAHLDPNDRNIGYSTFEFVVPRSLCNQGGNLHGGAVALIFDLCTSMTVPVVAREGYWDTGHVSRTLNCSYMRPAPEGTTVVVESEVVHLGKSLGMLRGVMRRKDDGAVCYSCEHHKAKVEWRPRFKL